MAEDRQEDEDRKQDEPISLSSAQARGASDVDENERGATLVPMLVIGLALMLVGVVVVLIVVR